MPPYQTVSSRVRSMQAVRLVTCIALLIVALVSVIVPLAARATGHLQVPPQSQSDSIMFQLDGRGEDVRVTFLEVNGGDVLDATGQVSITAITRVDGLVGQTRRDRTVIMQIHDLAAGDEPSHDLDDGALRTRIYDEAAAFLASRDEQWREQYEFVASGAYNRTAERYWPGYLYNIAAPLLCGLILLIGYRWWQVRRSIARIAAGHCPRCNYDLRFTQEVCPECGWERSDTNSRSVRARKEIHRGGRGGRGEGQRR